MDSPFLRLATTPAVAAAQRRYYGRPLTAAGSAEPAEALGPIERDFIGARDSFYLASVTESGWPYVQHRGGPPGFLRVLGPTRLAFGDVRGNRQMLSTGNVAANDRVALILVDYPQRSRLKLLGHAKVTPAGESPEAAAVTLPGFPPPERVVTIDVVAFDWNCPKFITPRYTRQEVEAAVAPLRARIAELEQQLIGKPKS